VGNNCLEYSEIDYCLDYLGYGSRGTEGELATAAEGPSYCMGGIEGILRFMGLGGYKRVDRKRCRQTRKILKKK